MSGDSRHPKGPNTDPLVPLHEMLQAGHRPDALSWYGAELQLHLLQFPPLQRALLLAGFSGGLMLWEKNVTVIAQASGGQNRGGRGEATSVRLFRMCG